MSARRAIPVIAVLVWAVALMHTSLPAPDAPGMRSAMSGPAATTEHAAMHAGMPEHALRVAAHPIADHPKAAPDACCAQCAHLCAGTVVVAQPLNPPGLVAVLARAEWSPSVRDGRGLARNRGPPPWTHPDLHDLSILRI